MWMSLEKAQAFNQRMELIKAKPYGDFDEMLEHSQIETRYIIMPPHAHHGLQTKAAQTLILICNAVCSLE
jgi:predicted dehydrogenase